MTPNVQYAQVGSGELIAGLCGTHSRVLCWNWAPVGGSQLWELTDELGRKAESNGGLESPQAPPLETMCVCVILSFPCLFFGLQDFEHWSSNTGSCLYQSTR